MEKRKLGKSQNATSLLGFGCMRLPLKNDGTIDQAEAFNLFDLAYQGGVNYYDTAYPYHHGQSEEVLGNWLQTIDRSSVLVATKSPVWLLTTPEDFDLYLTKQLTKLQTSYIDYYLLHALDQERFEKLIELDVFSKLEDAKRKGLIRHVGFSFHDSYNVFERILRHHPWDFCQIQLNYMDTDYQAGLAGLRLAESMGICVTVMEPIRGGSLAKVSDEIRQLFDSMDPLASPASFALRFVGSQRNVQTVLSGMSDRRQVEENLTTFTDFQPMNEHEIAKMLHVADLMRQKIKVPCTSCKYCMPCPYGIDIPGNFSRYNDAFVYDDVAKSKQRYVEWMDASERASACVSCQTCVSKCPQHILIPDRLVEVARLFEGE